MDNSYYIQSMLEKKVKAFQIIVCILGVIIVGAIGENVFLVLNGNFDKKSADADTAKCDNQAEQKDPNEGVSEDTISEKYIYVPEWGIKIKKADKLQQIYYSLDMSKGQGVLRVSAILYDTKVFDFKSNPKPELLRNLSAGMGIVSRVTTGSADTKYYTDPDPIYTDDDYEYYYSRPQTLYSEKDDEKALEEASIGAIEKMLKENITAL